MLESVTGPAAPQARQSAWPAKMSSHDHSKDYAILQLPNLPLPARFVESQLACTCTRLASPHTLYTTSRSNNLPLFICERFSPLESERGIDRSTAQSPPTVVARTSTTHGCAQRLAISNNLSCNCCTYNTSHSPCQIPAQFRSRPAGCTRGQHLRGAELDR